MAELFGRDKSTVSRHIRNVFAESELSRDSVVANFSTTAADEKTYQIKYQQKTLTPVEKAYLQSLKEAEKEIRKKSRKGKNNA